MDVVREINDSIYDSIIKAINEACREGIKANSIVINENMVKVPEYFNKDVRRIFPTMICGLNVYWTKNELPDGYSFAIFEDKYKQDRLTEYESICSDFGMSIDELRKAAEMYRYFKDLEEDLV